MTKFGRVEASVVVEVLVADVLPPFAPPIAVQWRAVADEVQAGWVLVNNIPQEPPAPPAPLWQERRERAFQVAIDRRVVLAIGVLIDQAEANRVASGAAKVPGFNQLLTRYEQIKQQHPEN